MKKNTPDPQKTETPEKPKTLKEKILYQLKEFGIVLAAFLVLNSFVLASFVVPTGSMENEVMTGDFLFVNKFIYGGTTPRVIPFTNVRLPWFRVPAIQKVERGDVIVFEFPGYRDEVKSEVFQFYLKRCMAIPGDTLQIRNRVVTINGQQAPWPRNVKFGTFSIVPEGTENPQIFPPGALWNEDNYGPIVVPYKGMVVGLEAGTFSRWRTLIQREGHEAELRGNTIFIDNKPSDSYTVKEDYYFGMGDHRDNSLDSRYWGFIPSEAIIGSPLIVYWSWNTDLPLYNIIGKLASVRFHRIGTLID